MNDDEDPLDWSAVERIFGQARQRPPAEREAFVWEMARGDRRLGEQVLVLLANDVDDSFLEPLGDDTLLDHLDQADAPRPDLTGHLLLGQYELGPLIGRGASGAVYEGIDRFTKRAVAVKVLNRAGNRPAARFELSSLRLLRLPGVVTLLDDGRDTALGICLVMERIDGVPFGPGAAPCPWPQVRRTTSALLETLARIHARGMIHKDLKPGNVLVDDQGLPTVLDLGIAGKPHRSESAKQMLIGTPAYMAPEVAQGALPDERSDLHPVGLMALEALTARRLHDGGYTPETLMRKQDLTDADVDAWLDDPHVPEQARRALGPLLAPAPYDRPASAREARVLFEPEVTAYRYPAVGAGTEAGLRAVFAGHERLFQIPSDAAHELWRRTHGTPKAVQAELDAWETARLGRFEADGFHIERGGIEELRAGFHPHVPAEAPTVPEDAKPLLPYVRVLPSPASRRVLAEAARLEPNAVDTALDALQHAGIVERAGSDAFALTARGQALRVPDRAPDYAGRLANAWPQGHPGRLELLIRAGRDAEVPAETIYAARHAFKEASLDACVRVCELGLRTNPPPGTEYALLVVLLRASIPQSSTVAIERALILVERSKLREAKREPLEQIARCALYTLAGRLERAWHALPERSAYDPDDVVLVLDDMVRTFLIRQLPPEEQEAQALALFGPPEAAKKMAAVSAWAWLRLFQNDYEQASALFERQAAMAPNEASRISALVNVLYTRMLLFHLDEAEAIAKEMLNAAAERRMAQVVAHVEVDLRDIQYARGEIVAADPELLEAVRALGHGQFTGRVVFQEAVYAWRRDELEQARRLAAEAVDPAYASRELVDPLARAFHAYVAPGTSKDGATSLTLILSDAETPSDTVQMIALMALRDPTWIEGLLPRFEKALHEIPNDTWHYRREVLSIEECTHTVKSQSGESQC